MRTVHVGSEPSSGLTVEAVMKGEVPDGYDVPAPGQVMFSTCCDVVDTSDVGQIRELRDLLTAWLDRQEDR